MPVFPDVASRITLSCVSAPDRSPSAIMRAAGRSFTEPPGLRHSALAYSSTLRRPASKLVRRMRGVFPIRSTTEAAVRRGPEVATDISDWSSPGLYQSPLFQPAFGIASLNPAELERLQLGLNLGPIPHGNHDHAVRDEILLGR